MKDKKKSKKSIGKGGHTPVKSGLWISPHRLKLDQRTKIAKLLKDLKAKLIEHLGGNVSFTERLLIDRIAHKCVKAHIYETNFFLNEEQGSDQHFLALVNSLRRDLQALGLHKKPGTLPSLEGYLKEKNGG
ncbi:MAG: hypothetical protein NT096_01635 [Proteobacteria bacterium]|nr:hypothetical protein [Pseudomonadota bacterium]